MSILKYKNYEGTAELDMDRRVCRGKILFIDDLVTYEATDPAGLQREFEAAVDDYLETCEALGREAQKPLSGQFNVRVTPAVHRAMKVKAIAEGINLNEAVGCAFECYLNGSNSVTNNHSHTYMVMADDRSQIFSAALADGQSSGEVVRVLQ